jgi:signal transduction histidine kinase
MAEVATNVLHNVGNVLNSVNVSHLMICGHVRKSGIGSVAQAAGLLEKNAECLAEFLTTDPIGKKMPAFLSNLARWLAEEQAAILAELAVLGGNIEHIKEIVSVQQCHAHASSLLEVLPITGLIENALQINAAGLAPHHIEIVREYADTPPAPLDKHKVMQILINLISNAKDSLVESQCRGKRIIVRAGCDHGGISLSVTDNGIGIPRENLTRIFAHGFTTKKEGHGFGLHGSALAAMEMGGSLSVESQGLGHGATFLLKLPLSPLSNAQAA